MEWIQRVADVSDPVRALEEWNRAAMATGHLGMHLGPEELGRIAQWIVDHCTDQPVRMAARSCLVHLHVHAVLARG